jgi:hypothetical protein
MYDFASYVICRHFAAKAFTNFHFEKTASFLTSRSANNQQQQQQSQSPSPRNNLNIQILQNNNSFSAPPPTSNQNNNNLGKKTTASPVTGGSPRDRTKSVMFPDHPPPNSTGATTPRNNNNNTKTPGTPNKDRDQDFPMSNTDGFMDNRSLIGVGQNNGTNNDETGSVTNGTKNNNNNDNNAKGIGRLFSQSIAALRNRSTAGAAPGNNHQSLLSESVYGHVLGATANLFGRDGNAAGPSAHGPVIVIETTKRKVVISDAAYRSDVLGNETSLKKAPPLFMITTEEIIQK